VLDHENPHTWPEVKAMTLNEVILLNDLFDARDEAAAIRRKRDRDREKDRESTRG
jgi:hypothetical protein